MKITCGTAAAILPEGASAAACLEACGVDPLPLAALNGGAVTELNDAIIQDCTLQPLTVADEEGRRIYERSLRFVALLALRRLCPGQRVRAEFSLGHGVLMRLPGYPATDELIEKLRMEMQAITALRLPFTRHTVRLQEAIDYFAADGQEDKVALLRLRPYDYFTLYECGGMMEYFYGAMVPDTGAVSVFGLYRIGSDFVLTLPERNDPSKACACPDMPKHLDVFAQSARWCDILGVLNAADLTALNNEGRMRDFIRVNEALHDKAIASIADEIHAKNRRVVLVAGPSSSGKTTFSRRLNIHLRVLGYHPLLISLDDYYRNRADIAPGPDGAPDLESIDALDLPLLNAQINALLRGEEVEVPRYNFKTGRREEEGVRERLPEGEPVIIEGIHGLNPSLSADMPQDAIFRIYVSALTCLNLDDHNRIRTTDVRLLRRCVRDWQFRGTLPTRTLSMWPSVRAGENTWIFPYQENADRVFNTALHYELPFLKATIGSALEEIPADSPERHLARVLLKTLHYIPEPPAGIWNEIPPTSILREFVGGLTFDET